MTRRIVITGAPGTGKTSLIAALKTQGFFCFEEISRQITREARYSGTDQLFLNDALGFSDLVIQKRIKQFMEAEEQEEKAVFMDRGLPDVIAYLNYVGAPYPVNYMEHCRSYRYDNIILLEPWKNIYAQDEERYESFQQAEQIHRHLVDTYKELNYPLITLPKDTVENRIKILLDSLNL